MFYDAVANKHGLPIDPIKAIVGPRPIGWISSRSATGADNLAPYSFFNIFSEQPHYIAFGSSGFKHSIANIEQTSVFAVNMATLQLREKMNATSASVAAEADEFAMAGLTKEECRLVACSRVKESPAALECRLHQILPLPDNDGVVKNWMMVGRVVGVHIEDTFIREGRVVTAEMQLIGRLGYADYVTAAPLWRMKRPS
jgi:flavin reductase (DIM6/NTAB) family NADH-FMN oxidoreductase RutF